MTGEVELEAVLDDELDAAEVIMAVLAALVGLAVLVELVVLVEAVLSGASGG